MKGRPRTTPVASDGASSLRWGVMGRRRNSEKSAINEMGTLKEERKILPSATRVKKKNPLGEETVEFHKPPS